MKEPTASEILLPVETQFSAGSFCARQGRNTQEDFDAVALGEMQERIFQSAHFARSERLSALLLYLLEAIQLADPATVDERTIGIQIFGRSSDWDPSVDPCVRVAMGRLRKKLDDYYESAGRNDPFRIVLAKGNYLPYIAANSVQAVAPNHLNGLDKPSQPLKGVNRRLIGVCFTVGVLLVVCLAVWLRTELGREHAMSFTVRPFSTELGVQFSPAISPDGRTIAYVWDGNQGHFNIYVRSVDGGPATRITHGEGDDFYPSWSPDGTHLAFLRNEGWEGKLVIIPNRGGLEEVVGTIATAPGQWTDDCGPLLGNPGPVWSRDGRELIAFDQGHFGIYAISIATRKHRQLTSDTQTSRDFFPLPSPDGRLLAYVHYESHGIGDLFVSGTDQGAEPRQITHDQATIKGISWTPDGRSLLFASNRTGPFELWRVDVQSAALQAVPADTSEAANPAIAPDGKWLAFDNFHENSNVNLAQLPSQDVPIPMRPVVTSLGRNREASLSPDGKKLLFVSDRSGSWQIWQSVPDGTDPHQVTHLKGSLVGSINWSPDNRHVVYDARPGGHSSIFLLDVYTGESTMLSRGSAEERTPSWSPDGQEVYFSSDREGSVSLYKMDITSRNTTLLAHDGFRAEATKDGEWIYFSNLYSVLWRIPQHGGAPVILPESLQPYSSSNWTVMGNDLLVLRKPSSGTSFELWKADTNLNKTRVGEIEASPETDVLGLRANPNGRSLLVSTLDQVASDIVIRIDTHK